MLKEAIEQDSELFMKAILNVEFLLTNILLEKAINICCDSLFGNEAKKNFIRNDFEKLLILALKYNFDFYSKIYKKAD